MRKMLDRITKNWSIHLKRIVLKISVSLRSDYICFVIFFFNIGNHLGREKVLSALSEKYYFVGMNNKVREYLLNCSSCRSRFKLEAMSDGSTSNVSDFDDMDDNDSNASFSEDGKPIKSEWPVRSQEALHFWDIVSF